MTIYTRAAWTTTSGICEGGLVRTMEALEKYGLTLDSDVSLQTILKELGLSDTLFSFCKVTKSSQKEAIRVLRQYMLEVTGLAGRFLLLLHPEYAEPLADANKVINKRCRGIKRPELMAATYAKIKALWKAETSPQDRHWLNVYLCMLSKQPDHLVATHASIALMDGAEVVGTRKEIHDRLYKTLEDLLGPE